MFLHRHSLAAEHFLVQKIQNKGNFFGYIKCDVEVPESLRTKFATFPAAFKNTSVIKNDIADLLINYAEEERIRSQNQKMWISNGGSRLVI